MPIGWNPGDGGAVYYAPSPRDTGGAAAPDPWWYLTDAAEEELEVVTGFWAWVEVWLEEVEPVVWTRWATSADERVCPECAPLDGAVWEEDDGPTPPLHVNCRCARVYAFTEWRVRLVADWQRLWMTG